MRKLSTFVDCLLITAVAVAAPTANEDFVVAEDAKTYTNAVNAANAYTDGKIAEIPEPDFSTNNTELVATIHRTEIDPTVPSWAKKTVGGFYSDNLYSLVNRDFYAKDSSIKSQNTIWLKGNLNPTVTVGRDKLSDNTFPYSRQTVLGFSAYEGFDYYAHYRSRGIYIWPWWNEDAEDSVAYLFPTNGNGGTFALTSDIPDVPAWALEAQKPTYTADEVGALPKTGGTMTGQLTVDGSILVSNGTGNGVVTAFVYALLSGIELREDADGRLVFQKDNVFTLVIPQVNGTLALLSDIKVKSVKLNGTALTPDAHGAVNVQATTPADIPPAVSNIVTAAYINDRVNVTPLAGRTYDFATNIGLYTAVRDVILALGGSVTNFPAIPQN